MTITNEVSHVTIPVAHFRPFNVITNEDVSFRIFRDEDWFKAVPQTSAEEYRLSGLPAELIFGYANRVVLAANNTDEEAMKVIKKIILALEVQGIA
jgi:hypothetical protein